MSKSKTHCVSQMLSCIEFENGASSYRLAEVSKRSVKSVSMLLHPLVAKGHLIVVLKPVRTYFVIDMDVVE